MLIICYYYRDCKAYIIDNAKKRESIFFYLTFEKLDYSNAILCGLLDNLQPNFRHIDF